MRIPVVVLSPSARVVHSNLYLYFVKTTHRASFSPCLVPQQPFSSSSTTTTNDIKVETTRSVKNNNNDNNNNNNSEEKTIAATPNKKRKRHRASTNGGGGTLSWMGDNVLSYKEFVHRFTVLSLYRNFMKEINVLPVEVDARKEFKHQVQHEFKAYKSTTDPYMIQKALSEGKRRFKELQQWTGSTSNNQNSQYDGDSWLNTPDEEDPRGRVGTGWPWER